MSTPYPSPNRGARARARARSRVSAFAAGLGTLAGTTARAEGNTIDFKFLHYGESDGRTQVENPELYFSRDLGEKGQIGLLLSYDAISGASPTGQRPSVDATSSASGSSVGALPTASFNDTRKALSLSYEKRFGSNIPSVTLSYSRESDYLSHGISLVDTWELPGGRSTLHFGAGGSSDLIHPVGSHDRFTKRSASVVAGWTRVLGPRDLFDVSLGLDRYRGYLTDPYKLVSVGFDVLPEARPSSRSRKAVVFKHGHYFLTRSALKTSYRYYWDTWSIKAHTFEASWEQRLGRRFIVTPRVRYYRQGHASFFGYEFDPPETFMSSDYRLSAFRSWLAGLGLVVEINERLSFNGAVSYMDQTGIDRVKPAPALLPPLTGSRTRLFGDDGGGDDEGGGGSAGSISPADLKTVTFTLGFTLKF